MRVEDARRIWIVGPTGAGKSTLAARLAHARGVPPVHLDDLHFRPGWVEVPLEEMVAPLEARLSGETWVVDGNYRRLRERFLERVELFVWLDLPFPHTLRRLLARTFRRAVLGESCCGGNQESLRRTFTSRESILWWALRSHRHRRRELARSLAGLPHLRLRTPAEVARLERGTSS